MSYIVGDFFDEWPSEEFAVVHLDDAWQRPHRNGAFGVTYDTHDFEESKRVIDRCWNSLIDGGWLLIDGDDWFTPRVIAYLQSEYGDVAESYTGGGFRRLGGVTYLAQSGEPDRSTAGMYLSNGGYSVVFAHKDETDRQTSESARQIASRVRGERGSMKPVEPYQNWISGLTTPTEKVGVPMAGTAPAAIACEKLNREWVAIDNDPDARDAFKRRLSEQNESIQASW